VGRRARVKQVHLGEKLLTIRQALGLSQNEILRYLKLEEQLERGIISNYEHGDVEPQLYVILKYAEAAGVYVDALINDDLDLPEKLPCSPKHPGIPRRKAPAKKER